MACPLIFGMVMLFMSGGPTTAFHLAIHPSDPVDANQVGQGRVNLMLGKGEASPHAKHVFEDFTEAVFQAELAVGENADPVVEDDRMEEPCFDAVVGDHCRAAVEWSKDVGMDKHPDWYPNLTVESSYREIQESLWRRKKAGCKKPCPETTTTTTTTTTLPMMNLEEMSIDQLKKYIDNEWDGHYSKEEWDARISEGDGTSNASSEAQADQASNATGDVPATGDAAQAPESTEQDGDVKPEPSAVDVRWWTGDAAPEQEAPQESTEQNSTVQEDNLTIKSEDSWDKRGDEVIGGEPTLPGCYMRLPTGCPNHQKKSNLWRHDLHAEQMDADDALCQARKVYWDEYCGSTDTRIMFVSQPDGVRPPQAGDAKSEPDQVAVDAPTTGDAAQTQEAPEERTEQDGAKLEDNITIKPIWADKLWPLTPLVEDSWDKRGDEVIGGEPTLPGCYMRLPSGCPNHQKKSTLWRHDLHAEQMDADDAKCQARKIYWDEYCGSTDTRIMFVPQPDGVGPPQAGDTKSEPDQVAVDAPTTGDAAQTQEAPEERTEQDGAKLDDNMTIKPQDSWDKRGDEVIGGEPTLPGCYMRLPSGCPNHHKKSNLWRHDLHAEQNDADDAKCQARKVFWDEYCGSTDTRIMFVPQPDEDRRPQDGDVKNEPEVAVDALEVAVAAPANGDAGEWRAPQGSTEQDGTGLEDSMAIKSEAADGLPTAHSAEQTPEALEQSTEQNSTEQEGDTASAPGLEDGTSRLDLPSADAAQQTDNASAPVGGEDADTNPSGEIWHEPLPLVDGDANVEAFEGIATTGEPADKPPPEPPASSSEESTDQPGTATEALGAGGAGVPEDVGTAAAGDPENVAAADAEDQNVSATGAGQLLGTAVGAAERPAPWGTAVSAAAEEPASAHAPPVTVNDEPLPEVDDDALDEAGRAKMAERAERARERAEAEEQMRSQIASELREEMAAQTSTTEESLESMKGRIKAEIKQKMMKDQMEAKVRAEIMREMMASADTDGTPQSQ